MSANFKILALATSCTLMLSGCPDYQASIEHSGILVAGTSEECVKSALSRTEGVSMSGVRKMEEAHSSDIYYDYKIEGQRGLFLIQHTHTGRIEVRNMLLKFNQPFSKDEKVLGEVLLSRVENQLKAECGIAIAGNGASEAGAH